MKTYTVEEVRDAILKYRASNAMTMQEFSDKFGVSRQTQHSMNTGKLYYITPKTIRKIISLLEENGK